MTDRDDEKTMSFGLRLILFFGWTGLCFFIWLWMTGAMIADVDPLATDAELAGAGMAGCVVAGCAGGTWFGGLVVFLVIYSLLRR